MNKPQILIIEDDNAIGNLISTTLETQHYQYRRAKNGASGVLEAASCRPDVILLDLGLPDMDGVDIIKKVRTWSNTPIIVISARSEDHDKVEALDAGADDYLTKPFSVEELLARLRVSLRRVRYDSEKVDEAASIYQNGGLKIDYAAGCTYQNGKEIHLTPIEYKLLCLLAQNTGKVLTHNYILNKIWSSALPSDTPSLRVFMAMLYPYRPAGEHRLPGLRPGCAAGPGALLGLMRDVGQLFDCEPVVLQRPDSPALLLFYPDTVFPWRDLAEVCGGALAGLEGLWPVTVYGTTARRETGELRAAVRADGTAVIRLRSVSGRPFDQLTGLCLRVEMDTPARAAAWAALCAGSARTRSSAALEPAQAAALGDGLPVRRPTGSRYAYLAWEEDAGVLDALEALTARQKEALWRGFLQDGTQPMEFQWLWDAYREGAVDSLLEWELTLQLTLEALGFAVVNGAGRFTVTGPDGSARSFDLIRGGPAEKLFLKILFPLDKRE